jgi:hypothetical protein
MNLTVGYSPDRPGPRLHPGRQELLDYVFRAQLHEHNDRRFIASEMRDGIGQR